MSDNPFGEMFGDIFNMLGQQSPNAWFDTATQLALNIARGTDGDPNPEPVERQRLEELAPLVARHVDALFSISSNTAVTAVNRSALTLAALAQWRPLIEPNLHTANLVAPDDQTEGVAPMMAQLAAAVGPLFAGFQTGSVAGHFSERAWSLAVLALPRLNTERLIVVNNLRAFADEWSLERDEVYVFAMAQELVASIVLSREGTGDALRALLLDSTHEAAAIQGDLMGRLQSLMGEGDVNALMADPERLLEGIELPEETDATRAINAATAVLLAFFEAAAHDVTTAMLGPRPQLVEAYRRHRRSDARGEDAAAALFGIATHGPHHDLAQAFVEHLRDAHGLRALDALLRVDGLPSAAELTDPEAWLARVTNSPLA